MHYFMCNCELLDIDVTVTHKIVPNNKKLCQIRVRHYEICTLENVTRLFFHLISVRWKTNRVTFSNAGLAFEFGA